MAKQPQTSEILDSPLPQDLDAERCVLGSIILNSGVREKLRFLSPEDFYLEANQVLFREMMSMEAVDDVLLLAQLRASGTLESVGGSAYLYELVQSVSVAAHAVYYARLVKEMAVKREMVSLNIGALQALYSGRWSAKQLAERQLRRLRRIAEEVSDE